MSRLPPPVQYTNAPELTEGAQDSDDRTGGKNPVHSGRNLDLWMQENNNFVTIL